MSVPTGNARSRVCTVGIGLIASAGCGFFHLDDVQPLPDGLEAGIDGPSEAAAPGDSSGPPDAGDGASGDRADVGASAHAVVFLSSAQYVGGALGGLGGAQAECNRLASGRLAGKFAPWLSDSTHSAIDKIPVAFAGPWYLVDKSQIAFPSRAAIGGPPMAAINLTEKGERGLDCVWSGTDEHGAATAGTCGGWVSTQNFGTTGYSDDASSISWTFATSMPCDQSCRLYCFQIEN